MKLEREIHQEKFKNDHQKLAINILFTHGWLFGKLSNIIKKKNITLSQYNILRILRGQHPKYSTISFIKSRMLDKTPDVSRLVDRLVEKKLVERFICTEDRRRVNVTISKKGLSLLKQLDFLDDDFKKIFHNISDKEVKTVNIILDKLRD